MAAPRGEEWRRLRVVVLGMRDAGSPFGTLRGDSNLLEFLWGIVRMRRGEITVSATQSGPATSGVR